MDSGNKSKIVDYDPTVHSNVAAIRIYNDGLEVKADILLNSGVVTTMKWDNLYARETYMKGVTAYTMFYDARLVELNFTRHIELFTKNN